MRVGYTETPVNSTTVDFGTGAIVTAVSVGGKSVFAIVDGTVKYWGSGLFGELGQGNNHDLGDTTATIPANIKPIK
jgi:hypothetical protein